MREILFRSKRTDNGEWVFGDLVHFPDRTKIDTHKNGQPWRGYDVDPDTVGQFTGLTDRNGKRIFEGDVIKRFWLGGEHLYRVIYESDCARFIGKCINRIGFTTIEGDGDCFEVIGNIHDNPELLEVGE